MSVHSAALVRRWLTPSLVDVFFCALLAASCAGPLGWSGLLADGDTGWHIRTGELILSTGRPPAVDPFSFTRAGETWFAWEWLADVVFAACGRAGGLRAVAGISSIALCLAAALVLAWMLRRGAGLWTGLAITLAAASASSIHALARPHVFSLVFYAAALWILDEDRRRPGRLLWALVPLAAVWANVHGAFTALIATLALAAAVERSRRYAAAALACLVASLANPYGWRLHLHIADFLSSRWILDHVQEFQSPSIRSESAVVFALMLLATAAVALRARRFDGLLALLWGFAALRSARHIPFFAIAAAPVLEAAAAALWRAADLRPGWRVWRDIGHDLGRRPWPSLWLPIGALALVAAAPEARFPAARFPARAVESAAATLAPAGSMPRILTSDQWADYLIYRLYPRQRVFFDGRSDFYGPAIGGDYRSLLEAGPRWRGLLDHYGFSVALLPRDWPLASMLADDPGWRRVYQDEVAVVFVRETAPALRTDSEV